MLRRFSREMFQIITGYIYFIQMDKIGPIKIGFTKDIGKRLISLQTASPYPLNFLCCFPGNEKMERELHNCFKDVRQRGEWFLPHKIIFEEIEEQRRINKKNGFILPKLEDLGNFTLSGIGG